jgi:hypothetical protein
LMRAKTPSQTSATTQQHEAHASAPTWNWRLHWKISSVREPAIRQGLRQREVRLAKTGPKFVWPKCRSAHPARTHRAAQARGPRRPADRPTYQKSHRTYHEHKRSSADCNRICPSGQGDRPEYRRASTRRLVQP